MAKIGSKMKGFLRLKNVVLRQRRVQSLAVEIQGIISLGGIEISQSMLKQKKNVGRDTLKMSSSGSSFLAAWSAFLIC